VGSGGKYLNETGLRRIEDDLRAVVFSITSHRGVEMPIYLVLSYKDGGPDGAPQKIEARDEQVAAEKVCGTGLVEAFQLQDIRVMVSPIAMPNVRKLFRLPVRNPRAARPSR
jgi:hypothetical protein